MGNARGASRRGIRAPRAGVHGFAFPQGVETLLPAAVVLDTIILRALLFGGGALFVLLLGDVLAKPVLRVAFLAAAAGVFAPFGARTFGELFVPVLAGALTGLAVLAAMAVFLHDDPLVYVFEAVLLTAAGAGADLVSSGIAPWVWNGAAIDAAVALLVAFRGLDGAFWPRPARSQRRVKGSS